MADRNYIRHISKDDKYCYCGREKLMGEWTYVDLQHALASKERDWIQPCLHCLKQASKEVKV